MPVLPVLVTLFVVLIMTKAGMAETLPGALARAYADNPTLNAERAGVRANDENVPRALSGYRPSIAATASAGTSYVTGRTGLFQGRYRETLFERQIGLQVSQNLFDGFRTANSVRQAESQVLGSRESLRRTEHDTLYSAAQSYMDVLRDTAILDLQRNNVEVLEEQLYQTRERFLVGQITRTDVAQAQSRLAAAKSQVSVAGANLQASIAGFRQVVGVEPRRLAPGRPIG
jgi:outer membrane protein